MKHMIYLAAGNSRRFSSNKLLADFQGKPLYSYGLELLLSVLERHADTTLTIVSQYSQLLGGSRSVFQLMNQEVYETPEKSNGSSGSLKNPSDINAYSKNQFDNGFSIVERFHTVYSPESCNGISYTIKNAIRSLKENYPEHLTKEDSILFLVADQPFLRMESLEKLLLCGDDGRNLWGASVRFKDRVGNPTLFSAKLLPELESLEGDRGGRSILKGYPILYVDAETEQELADIDTVEDLVVYLSSL